MSQNKTVIQGLEPADGRPGGPRGNMNVGGPAPDFYSRSSGKSAAKGTYVPGMGGGGAAPARMDEPVAEVPRTRKAVHTGKPIYGFLYSISRTGAGEFWPLQLGANNIGQSADADVLLPEATVSNKHAVIVVRQIKSTGKIIAAISDERSTNGTLLNGETLGFTPEECHNGDIITVGDNYELLLILIDPTEHGLKVAENFTPVVIDDEEDDEVPNFNHGATNPGGYNPYAGPTEWGTIGGNSGGGTVGMNGTTFGKKGGTQAI